MNKEIGLSVEELDNIFTLIKQGKNTDNCLDNKIYEAYLPLIDLYAKKFSLNVEKVQDLYNDVFTCVYSNTLAEVVPVANFTISFENLLAKVCMKEKTEKKAFRSEILGSAYAKREANRKEQEQQKARESATQSLLFVINVLDEIAADEELAESYGLTAQKIAVIKDYYGLNRQHKRYSSVELAEKYNITESRVKAVIVTGVKTIRNMQDFDQIKAELK